VSSWGAERGTGGEFVGSQGDEVDSEEFWG